MSTKFYKKHIMICEDEISWRELQMQRHTLIHLALGDGSKKLTDQEATHLQGLLNLTDAIIDDARQKGIKVPSLDDVTLDLLADV